MTAARPLRRPISPSRQAAEQVRRQELMMQAQALMTGNTAAYGTAPAQAKPVEPVLNGPIDQVEALKALGLYRKSVRHRPVLSGYTPHKVSRPIIFPHRPDQYLTKLSRSVSREWVQILTLVSSTSLAGGKAYASQGLNLVRIVEALRKHCYLETDVDGRPVKVREQVVQVVDGEAFCFARECGMSPSTFYRALQHPLAHLFIRTQVVQVIEAETEARRNVATLFSVSLYEPVIPDILKDLEELYWSEKVELPGEFVVPDYACQDDAYKGRPRTTQKQKEPCGKVESGLGSSFCDGNVGARDRFLRWVDGAALISAAGQQDHVDISKENLGACIDRLRNLNPGIWEFAVQIAIHHDGYEQAPIAAIGYYKALIHLGVGPVRHWIQRLEKWKLKGQIITTPGRLLMHHLNKEARSRTGFPIKDLGTEKEV